MTDLNNPETIEIHGLRTITKLCHFGADNNMEGCTFTEIVERLFAELEKAKAQAVPEGFKIVPIELSEEIAERLALERVQKPRPENDPVWVEIAERAYKSNLLAKKWELVREYKILTEASESGAEG
ncbi:TPA: DUF551 domain-containing protein [Acinetobacter baumannii]|jgi:DNA-directed RNA polymerase subunit H (RpoH/RPB5)